ncbi:hypothetical protein [Algoriphagus boritolerans]|uniref:hypothetical protein n=1 Tax=Algoriphagus boritolerans TaxID=308111 RepID=UPI000A8A537F
MNRRIALRHLALISGGLVLIPSCDFSSDDILAAYQNLKVTASQKITPGGHFRYHHTCRRNKGSTESGSS